MHFSKSSFSFLHNSSLCFFLFNARAGVGGLRAPAAGWYACCLPLLLVFELSVQLLPRALSFIPC